MAGLIPFNPRNRRGLIGRDDFFSMLDDFFNDNYLPFRSPKNETFKIDVEEKESEYIVTAELPGAQKEEIHLDFADGRLLIGVKKSENIEEESKNYVHREIRNSSVSRSVYLVDGAYEGIKAKLNDGILQVVVPKQAPKEEQSTRINIE